MYLWCSGPRNVVADEPVVAKASSKKVVSLDDPQPATPTQTMLGAGKLVSWFLVDRGASDGAD